jgi:putative ABC transport system permease protein
MGTLRQDIRFAIRMLLKNPGFTTVIVLTLALGIGANAAIFSVLNAVFLKSLPYHNPDRIVLIWGATQDSQRNQVSFPDSIDFRAQNHVFEDLANFGNWDPVLTGSGEPEHIPALLVTDGYFKVMDARPLLGRTFLPEENYDGRDYEAILTYGFWRNRFGSDPSIVGRSILLDGHLHTIVGVMPSDFAPLPERLSTNKPAQLYRPVGENYDEKMRSGRNLRAVARLKPGVTLAQAQAEMNTITRRLQQLHPETNTDTGVHLVLLREDLVGYLRLTLLLLSAAVGCVLLIACANVANLLLARATARQKEIAVRAALGAGRARLVRQFLTESALLSLVGGALGLLLAIWGTEVLVLKGAKAIPFLTTVRLDYGVLSFTFAVSLLTGVFFGVFPALRISRPDLIETLKEGGRTTGAASTRSGLRSALVVAELAMALVLLVAAGLMIKSLLRLRAVSPGFNPENVVTMSFGLPSTRYPEPEKKVAFCNKLLERAARIPGVRAAALFRPLPLSTDFDQTGVEIVGHPFPVGQEPSADRYMVSSNAIAAMQIPLLRGREFSELDVADSPGVVIVSQTMAKNFWPNEDAIGKHIRLPWEPGNKIKERAVIGIVADIKQYGLDTPNTPQLYVPAAQYAAIGPVLVVRTESNSSASVTALRALIRSMDKDEAVSAVTTYDELLADSIALRRFTMLLLGLFAGVAFLLAAVGIFGVMSYLVAQRTHEIGIRVALGAQAQDVLQLVLGHGLQLALAGAAMGAAVALVSLPVMSSLVFGISATDPLTFVSVAFLLVGVSLLACYIPARRAMRVDPIVALRYE